MSPGLSPRAMAPALPRGDRLAARPPATARACPSAPSPLACLSRLLSARDRV